MAGNQAWHRLMQTQTNSLKKTVPKRHSHTVCKSIAERIYSSQRSQMLGKLNKTVPLVIYIAFTIVCIWPFMSIITITDKNYSNIVSVLSIYNISLSLLYK